jgi:hypothetical protein
MQNEMGRTRLPPAGPPGGHGLAERESATSGPQLLRADPGWAIAAMGLASSAVAVPFLLWNVLLAILNSSIMKHQHSSSRPAVVRGGSAYPTFSNSDPGEVSIRAPRSDPFRPSPLSTPLRTLDDLKKASQQLAEMDERDTAIDH